MNSYKAKAAVNDRLNDSGFYHARLLRLGTIATLHGALMFAFLFALLVNAGQSAQAQTETVLYNFSGHGSDGGSPTTGVTSDGKGNFYGTSSLGGASGTVFELSPNGNGGWNETVLYSFTGGADGGTPFYSSLIFDNAGNLYGTTWNGGKYGCGNVFELSPAGGGWSEAVLYSFTGGTDGCEPTGNLGFDLAGNLYGITGLYGSAETGTVFELSPSGGGWTEQTIYTFGGYTGNQLGLVVDASGNVFGITTSTAFKLTPNGKGGWNAAVIHTFAGGAKDGSVPEGTPTLDSKGNLYGTTYYGGKYNDGSVWRLSPSKKLWKEKLLYSFKGGAKKMARILMPGLCSTPQGTSTAPRAKAAMASGPSLNSQSAAPPTKRKSSGASREAQTEICRMEG